MKINIFRSKQHLIAPLIVVSILLGLLFSYFTWFAPGPTKKVVTSSSYEIVVHDGDVNKTVEYFKSKNFWNKNNHDKEIDVPRIIMSVTSKRWQQESEKVPVRTKKKIFYHTIVPMVLLANELILQERQEIEAINRRQHLNKPLSAKEHARLQSIARKYRLQAVDDPQKLMDGLLKRVDTIPPSLALGQTAYESGYGTSRFAIEGNALFGQWTYSGDGMKPREHRPGKGNYGVAAYDWPFDSVRSYMLNLNTHHAYQELRDKRAALRKQGREISGQALADTLGNYSEKGMEYVATLKSIIAFNGLEVADKAYLRDEPITLVVGVSDVRKVEETKALIEQLRASGELDRIVKSMYLDGKE